MSRGKYRRKRERGPLEHGRGPAIPGRPFIHVDPASGPDKGVAMMFMAHRDGRLEALGRAEGFTATPADPGSIADLTPNARRLIGNAVVAAAHRYVPAAELEALHRRLREARYTPPPWAPLTTADLTPAQRHGLARAAASIGHAAGGLLGALNVLRERWGAAEHHRATQALAQELRELTGRNRLLPINSRFRCSEAMTIPAPPPEATLLAAYDRPLTDAEMAQATSGGPMPGGAIAGRSARMLIIDDPIGELELETPPEDWTPGQAWILEQATRALAVPAELLEEEAAVRKIQELGPWIP